MDLYPTPIQNAPTQNSALQALAQFLSQHVKQQDGGVQQQNMQGQGAPAPVQTQGGTSPVGGMIDNGLSNLFTQGAAQATNLPWLAGGNSSTALSALANLFMA